MAASQRVRRGTALAVITLALVLGGCGRRGKLEPPPDPDHPFALGTPKPVGTDAAGNPDEKNKAGVHRRARNPPIKRPDESFILDPLL